MIKNNDEETEAARKWGDIRGGYPIFYVSHGVGRVITVTGLRRRPGHHPPYLQHS